MFKVNNTPERRQWRDSGVFIVNFETYFTPCSSVSIVNFQHVIAGWVSKEIQPISHQCSISIPSGKIRK